MFQAMSVIRDLEKLQSLSLALLEGIGDLETMANYTMLHTDTLQVRGAIYLIYSVLWPQVIHIPIHVRILTYISIYYISCSSGMKQQSKHM